MKFKKISINLEEQFKKLSISKEKKEPNNKNDCIFCNILYNEKDLIIFEDDQTFAFYDIELKTAKDHILICPKKHIKDAKCLNQKDIPLLQKLSNNGLNLMKEKHPQCQLNEFRFGYHIPPSNSVDHLHLHCFQLPIENKLYDKFLYGELLRSEQYIIKELIKQKL